MHRMRGFCQPFAKNKAVKRAQNQAFRAAGRAGHHANVLRLQAIFLKMRQRFGAGVDA